MVFTFRPEYCSDSQRNGVRLQTGIAFAFDRIPQESLEAVQKTSAVILSAIKTDESISQDAPEPSREVAESAVEPAPETKRTRHSHNQTATTEAA